MTFGLCCCGGFDTGEMGLMMPWYVWPGPKYDELIASTMHIPAGSKSAIVTGEASGPQRPLSSLHQEYWGKLSKSGWTLYGYIHCDRGQRDLEKVLDDIDTWAALYGSAVRGIFVDETPAHYTPELIEYMTALISRARSHGLQIALNPGTEMHDGGAVASKVDVVVAFEASSDTWQGAGKGIRSAYDSYGVAGAAMIHSFPAPKESQRRRQLGALMRAAKARGFSLVFVTDACMPDPYSKLPSFWRSEVEFIGPEVGPVITGYAPAAVAAS